MARIVIDARESGTGTGRYIDKLIEYLYKLNPAEEIILLAKPHRLEFLAGIAPNFKAVTTKYKEFTFGEQLGFLRQINRLKPDLVHFGMTQQPVFYRGRSVTTMHDLTTLRFYNPVKFWPVFKFKQAVYCLVAKRVAKKSEVVITPSQFVKEDIVKFASVKPDKISVTHESADPITAKADPMKDLSDKNFIMYVGRAQPHKNLDRLVEAFALLKDKQPSLKLVLVGKLDGNYQLLQKHIASKQIENVVLAGFVSDGQLKWLYQNTRAYIFASLSEGFGLPALEAMLTGAPVISSNATCLPEIYGEAALYFNPKDISDMAEKISMVLNDQKLRGDLIRRGRTQAGKYSWAKMAKQTLEVYRQVLSR